MSNVSQINVGNNTYDIKDTTARSGLANKQDIIQKTTLPTASLTEEGNIYQYIGATGNGLTNGYFYKCVNNSGTYSWQAIDVQAGGGGDVSGKADKVSTATAGNFAGLDATGNLTDSGSKASDFATSAQGGKADTAVQTIQIGGTAQTKTNGVVNLPAYPTTLPASDTTSSYSASGTVPVNGTAVAAALGTLDVSSVGGSGKYIQSISETDGKISATAADMPTSLPASDVHDWAKASSKPSYTASEVGAIATTTKGAANGVAELDSAGKVPSSQLPSFVDDVLEYTAKANFPTTGEAGKIYVDKTTNLTWRWSGSAYVEISPSLALGETSSTAYRGDRGATAYSHATDSNRLTTAKSEGLYKIATTVEGHVKSVTEVQKSDITGLGIPSQDTTYSAATQSAAGLMSAADKTKLDGIATGAQVNAVTSVAGKTGAVTLNSSDVGLGNVGNFKAVSTVASQGLSSTEQANARANIGAGTSSFDGAYSSLSGTPTLGTAAAKDVASSGNASTTQVVMGNDTRLSDARTPTSHGHDAATTSNAGFMSASDKTKLNGLANIKSIGSGLDLNGSTGELTATGGAVNSVNGQTGDVVLTASDVGALPDNTAIPSKTSDLTNDSNFVADASYVHTDNNYTATEKSKLSGIDANATANTIIDTSCTLTVAGWTGSAAPYTQTVNVADVLATDRAWVDLSVSSTVSTGLDEIDDWALISKIESGSGTLTFSCYEDKPTVALTANVKVVR